MGHSPGHRPMPLTRPPAYAWWPYRKGVKVNQRKLENLKALIYWNWPLVSLKTIYIRDGEGMWNFDKYEKWSQLLFKRKFLYVLMNMQLTSFCRWIFVSWMMLCGIIFFVLVHFGLFWIYGLIDQRVRKGSSLLFFSFLF